MPGYHLYGGVTAALGLPSTVRQHDNLFSFRWFFCLERHTIRRTATIRRPPLHDRAARRHPARREARRSRASRAASVSRIQRPPRTVHAARTHVAHAARAARASRTHRRRDIRSRGTLARRPRGTSRPTPAPPLRRRSLLHPAVAVVRVGGAGAEGPAPRRCSSRRTRPAAPRTRTRVPGCSRSTARSAHTARASSRRR